MHVRPCTWLAEPLTESKVPAAVIATFAVTRMVTVAFDAMFFPCKLASAAFEAAARPAKPMDNTDFDLTWRKRVMKDVVSYALRELRGDDVREWRRKISRQMLY